jgi:uncharacterized membrane protein required for colicin V production
VVNLLGMLVSRAVRSVSLGFADRILGAVIGFAEGFGFVAVILYLISNTAFGQRIITESLWGTEILRIVSTVISGFLGGTGQDLQKMIKDPKHGV